MKNRFQLSVFVLMLASSGFLRAQINVDSIFSIAIEKAHSGSYAAAINDAKAALSSDTTRGDICVFLANVYSWSQKNDSALIFIDKAKKLNYLNDDFYDSYLNILLRSEKYEELAAACEEAEKNNYSDTKNLLTKKLIAYAQTGEYEKGISLFKDEKNQAFLQEKTIDELYTSLLMKQRTNLLSVNYSLDMFDNNDPQHLFSLGNAIQVKNRNIGLNANYAHRFGKNDVQLELNDYSVIYKKNYLYFNYGYALTADLFPRHRTGLEYYFAISPHWDGSLGGRYMYYPNAVNKNVFIFTGNVGHYFGNNWASLRPFYVVQNNLQSLSVLFKYRLYASDSRNFWGLEAGVGNSPDDILTTSQSSFNELMSYRIKLEKNFKVNRISDVNIGLGYMYEQINQNATKQFRNRYILEIGYKYRF